MLTLALTALLQATPAPPAAGEPGGPGLAIHSAKILTCSWEKNEVFDHGTLLVKDGKIEAIGRARDIQVPDGYEVLDVGDRWLAPGMIDLHCHAAGASLFPPQGVNDLNDLIYLANPGLRASAAVEPGVFDMEMGLAGGVTAALYIPGSGSNIGGAGVLIKAGFDEYEDILSTLR